MILRLTKTDGQKIHLPYTSVMAWRRIKSTNPFDGTKSEWTLINITFQFEKDHTVSVLELPEEIDALYERAANPVDTVCIDGTNMEKL